MTLTDHTVHCMAYHQLGQYALRMYNFEMCNTHLGEIPLINVLVLSVYHCLVLNLYPLVIYLSIFLSLHAPSDVVPLSLVGYYLVIC